MTEHRQHVPTFMVHQEFEPYTLYGICQQRLALLAGELVALLDFLGTLFGIPHEVLGLTVLAWGNSVGDLSTNLTMARRGLSNMAMTACFAGPIFNILVALGVGFMQYLSATGLSSTTVRLEASHPSLPASSSLLPFCFLHAL